MNQVTFSENEFKDVLSKNKADKKIVVLKFTAEWCGPCKKIKPHCEEFCKNMSENILFYEIDVDESIESVPFISEPVKKKRTRSTK